MAKVTRRSSGFSRKVRSEASRQLTAALFAGGEEIQVEAQISITNGAVSGKGHVPSKPGKPPNQDTGVLAGNIGVRVARPLVVEVFSEAPYAALLEFGTSKMAERPYLRPAGAKKATEVQSLFAATAAKIARGGSVV